METPLPIKFVQAVLSHWGTLLTSGIAIAALGVWQSTGHLVPPPVYWAIAIVGFLVGAYRVWRDQFRQLEDSKQKQADLQFALDAHKRWEFQAEYVGASRTVFTYENGNSPWMTVWIQVRVHNRNSVPTTVYPLRVSVKLKDSTDKSFQKATIFPGTQVSFDNPEEFTQFEVAASGTTELLFNSRRYNPPQIAEYLQDGPLPITLELGETYGKVCEITGPMKLAGIEKQS